MIRRLGSPALRRAFVLATCLPLLGVGCGYHLIRHEAALAGAKTIAIRGFVNETYEAGVDSVVSDAMTREFMERGVLQVTRQAGDADLVMAGSVDDVRIIARSFSSVQFALEYEVWITVSVNVLRRDGTPMRMAAYSHSANERYLASPDVEVTRTYREEAIRRVSGILAARVHDALLVPVIP